MTLEELQQSVDKDFKLDDTELDTESVKIPLLHNKYLQHFSVKIQRTDTTKILMRPERFERPTV